MSKKKTKINIEEIKEVLKGTWFWYKVCEGCETVVMYVENFCPKCRGYHFDENRKRVINEIVTKYEEKIKRNNDSEQSECSD
jgi:RNA polymerase subunit RPABC4/transcription elongation factor Spt4